MDGLTAFITHVCVKSISTQLRPIVKLFANIHLAIALSNNSSTETHTLLSMGAAAVGSVLNPMLLVTIEAHFIASHCALWRTICGSMQTFHTYS